MVYTIKELADLSGVTTRTLRHYDEIGLLSPSRQESSGYRIYTEKEVDLLQQILLYRSMNFKLSKIKEILTDENFDLNKALMDYNNLVKQENKLIPW